MTETRQLRVEILSGPLDGETVSLTDGTEWTCGSEGLLAFPWDGELGQPQATLTSENESWVLQGYKAPHGIYRLNTSERITNGRIQLSDGDVLKGSDTWLLVHI